MPANIRGHLLLYHLSGLHRCEPILSCVRLAVLPALSLRIVGMRDASGDSRLWLETCAAFQSSRANSGSPLSPRSMVTSAARFSQIILITDNPMDPWHLLLHLLSGSDGSLKYGKMPVEQSSTLEDVTSQWTLPAPSALKKALQALKLHETASNLALAKSGMVPFRRSEILRWLLAND